MAVLDDKDYILLRLKADDIPYAHQLEKESYPEDEAASLESMTMRQKDAGEFFYGLFEQQQRPPRLIGFVNGTCCQGLELTHETMSTHDPCGSTLCIHSVVIQAKYRREGLGTKMLTEYISQILQQQPEIITHLRLIAKAYLLQFYQQCGFTLLQISPVVHGRDQWFELGLDRLSIFRGREFLQIDSFASEMFAGNPAAVVFCQGDEDDIWMAKWAQEFNLSETAFLSPTSTTTTSTSSLWHLRWFTPQVEVDLCGHATLAAAHALWETGRVPIHRSIDFQTKSGLLTAIKKFSGGGRIELKFPAEPPHEVAEEEEAYQKECILQGLGCKAQDILYWGKNGLTDRLVVLTPEAFHGLDQQEKPIDFESLKKVDCRGIIVSAKGGEGSYDCYDFVSRFFAPRVGINEDPVTGSAHCCLAPYWSSLSQVLGGEEEKKKVLLGYQASSRGGEIEVEVDASGQWVYLRGKALTVQYGYLRKK